MPGLEDIVVSPAGLCRCPSCGSYTRAEPRVERTRCAFCGKSILSAPWRGPAAGLHRREARALLGRSRDLLLALAAAGDATSKAKKGGAG